VLRYAMKVKWVDFAGKKACLTIKQEKNGKCHKATTISSIVQARRQEAKDSPNFGAYIFSLSYLRSKGQPVSHNAVLTEFGKCGSRAGFLNIGSHTSCKSKRRILLENGDPLKYITKLLGQSNPASTLIYIRIHVGDCGHTISRVISWRGMVAMKKRTIAPITIISLLACQSLTVLNKKS